MSPLLPNYRSRWLRCKLSALFVLFISFLPLAHATDVPTPEAMRLLKSNCFSCHNDEKKKGGLVMTTREALLKGGDNGATLDLKSPEKSSKSAC